jgi:phosphoribosyl 1,2-cyclic phosphate phosphodiesterase
MGFKFESIVYLSDISQMPENVRELAKNCELLILDCLREFEDHPSHFILGNSLEEVRKIRPKKTLFVGFNHTVDHEEFSQKLRY